MVLGESFKPIRPTSDLVVEDPTKQQQIISKPYKRPKNDNDTFFIKYTFSFLAASCAETSISVLNFFNYI